MVSQRKKSLTIIYCGNYKVFDGLFLSIQSILKRTKYPIRFYFLSGNLSKIDKTYKPLNKKQKDILTKLTKKNNSMFKQIDCTKLFFEKFNQTDTKINFKYGTPYTLFRLFIPEICKENKILYLDTDTLIGGEIFEAFDINIDNKEICVCHDALNSKSKAKRDWFNDGSILVNVKCIRNTKLFTKAFEYCLKNKPKYIDQDALNILATKVKFGKDENRFNYQPNLFLRKIFFANSFSKKKPIIYHFYGKPPFYKKPGSKGFLEMTKAKKMNFWEKELENGKNICMKNK